MYISGAIAIKNSKILNKHYLLIYLFTIKNKVLQLMGICRINTFRKRKEKYSLCGSVKDHHESQTISNTSASPGCQT